MCLLAGKEWKQRVQRCAMDEEETVTPWVGWLRFYGLKFLVPCIQTKFCRDVYHFK